MNRKFVVVAFSVLLVCGIAAIVVGALVAGTADGFGDAPPPIAESIVQRRIGIIIFVSGIVASVGSAIACYVIERPDSS